MKLRLDPDDAYIPFEGWAFVHFRTSHPGFAFADCLNRLYGLNLSRIDNMVIDNTEWPLYLYNDPIGHLRYYLAERPATSSPIPWNAGDKLLIINGESSEYTAMDIYSDFTSTEPFDDGDLLAREHAALIESLLANLTIATLLNFSDSHDSPKKRKNIATMQRYIEHMLTHFDHEHLDISSDERMRMDYRPGKI